MFDLGWGELVVIGVIALIVIGPKELPTVLRTLGQTMGKVKRMASEFQGQFQEALREAELDGLKKQAEDLTGDLNKSMSEFTNFDPLSDTQKEIESSFEPEPDHEPSEAAEALPAAEPLPQVERPKPVAVAEARSEPAAEPLPPAEPAPVSAEELAAPPRKSAEGSA